MKMAELRWKKRKDGSLVTVSKDDVYRIFSTKEKILGLYDVWILTIDGKKVYESDFSDGKPQCKRIASKLASGAKPLYLKVEEELNERDKVIFRQYVGYLDAKNLPMMPGEGKAKFVEAAKQGCYPNYPLGESLGFSKEQLPHDYLLSLQIELWPIYTYAQRKKSKEMTKKNKHLKQAPEKPVQKASKPRQISLIDSLEQYRGAPARIRNTKRLTRVYGAREHRFRLKNAKFSTILKWINKVRDFYKEHGEYPTVMGMLAWIRSKELNSEERKRKAGQRLISILKEEYKAEREQTQTMVIKSEEEPKEGPNTTTKKPKKKKDRFGNKEGTNAAKINAVMTDKAHTPVWIKKKAGVTSAVHGQMNYLIKNGFAVKIEKKNKVVRYRLRTAEDLPFLKVEKPNKKKKKKGKK